MIKRTLIILFVCLIFTPIFCTSVFSYYGIPESFNGRDIIGVGMGDTGVGNLLRPNSSLFNPSLSVNSTYTTFSTAYSFGNITIKNNQNNTSFKSDQSFFPYFNLSVPVYQHRFGFSYNSLGAGKYTTESTLSDSLGIHTEISKANQSLYKGDFFYANMNDYVNFGVTMSLIFGHAVKYYKADYEDEDLIDSKYEIEETFKNPGFGIGLSKIINDNFSVGANFSLPVKLNGNKTEKTIAYTENLPESNYELPFKIAVGTAYRYAKYFNAALDIDYDLWSTVDTYKNADNTIKLGIGTEYEGNDKAHSYFLRIPQRVGFSYKEVPLDAVNSESHTLQEISGTYGISFPIKARDSRLDFAVKVFNRTSTQTDFEESGFLLSVGTVGFDIFKRPLDRKGHRDIPKADEN